MKVIYLIRSVGMTGGVKVFFQHVQLLRNLGHEIPILTKKILDNWKFPIVPTIIPSFTEKNIPEADAYVVSVPKDVEEVWPVAKKRNIPLFHFMQGFEPDYIMQRITGDVIPDRFRSNDVLTKVRYKKKIWGWKRKLKRFDNIYILPTIKMAISPHLIDGMEKRHGTRPYLLPNGIDLGMFYPKQKTLDYSGVLNIMSVGNSRIEYKRVPDIWEAVRILKGKGVKVQFTRVSPADIDDVEKNLGIVDRFFVRISEKEIAELYRESHVLAAVSTEIEGFGLPPVEAMAAGTPVILTRVPPFLAFDAIHDYAHFVDVRRPDEIAKGIMEIAHNETLRDKLIKRGLEVAQQYSLSHIGVLLENILKDHISVRR